MRPSVRQFHLGVLRETEQCVYYTLRYFTSTEGGAAMRARGLDGSKSSAAAFELVRSRSNLMLHTLVAVGARILEHDKTFSTVLAEIERLLDSELPAMDSVWDLKAQVLIVMYFGRWDILPRIVSLAAAHQLPQAVGDLLQAAATTSRPDFDEEATVERARLWLLIWICDKL